MPDWTGLISVALLLFTMVALWRSRSSAFLLCKAPLPF